MAVRPYTQIYRMAGEGHMDCNNETCRRLEFLSFKTLICVCMYVCMKSGRAESESIGLPLQSPLNSTPHVSLKEKLIFKTDKHVNSAELFLESINFSPKI